MLQAGDVVAIGGKRNQLIEFLGPRNAEVEDRELLDTPTEGVDIYITNKAVNDRTLEDLAREPGARGVFLRKIKRGPTETVIPVLPKTKLYRGDVVTLVGRTRDINATAKTLGYVDRPTTVTDVAYMSLAITVGTLIGAIVLNVGGYSADPVHGRRRADRGDHLRLVIAPFTRPSAAFRSRRCGS